MYSVKFVKFRAQYYMVEDISLFNFFFFFFPLFFFFFFLEVMFMFHRNKANISNCFLRGHFNGVFDIVFCEK